MTLESRLCQLIIKDQKEGKDFKEIDNLGRQIERLARVRRYEQPGGHEGDLNPSVANRNAKPRKKAQPNEFNEEQIQQLHDAFMQWQFDYQKTWYRAGLKHRIRNILKSRQIGATNYFSYEALDDALTTGRNQIFISASKAQAHVFKQYITEFARDSVGVELQGADKIELFNGATLYFLGTNFRTAQSYHGNLYFDEYFWVYKFQELRKVTSGMAIHKKWRQTYFSTPSSLLHDAYPYWSGEHFNKGKPRDRQVEIDLSHSALSKGLPCPDGIWRQIVTVEDAMAGGCDLFDLDQLRLEYSDDEWLNLLMCEFVDDNQSVFGLSLMQRCMVDSWEEWGDFKPFTQRPLGNKPVWIGYDPNGESENSDAAGLVVVAPPAVPGGKFRIIERMQLRGLDYEAQAERIRLLTQTYNVTHIGIDTTGLGSAVYQLVRKFFPAAVAINYDPAVKTQMVLKAFNVITRGRLLFDSGWRDMIQAFMAIRKTTTAGGRHVTYIAGRSNKGSGKGHADLAWATMHALWHEPLEGTTTNNSSMMEIYG